MSNCAKDGVGWYFDYNTNVNTTSLSGVNYIFDCTGFVQDVFVYGFGTFNLSATKSLLYIYNSDINVNINVRKTINSGSLNTYHIYVNNYKVNINAHSNTHSGSGSIYYVLRSATITSTYDYVTGTGNALQYGNLYVDYSTRLEITTTNAAILCIGNGQINFKGVIISTLAFDACKINANLTYLSGSVNGYGIINCPVISGGIFNCTSGSLIINGNCSASTLLANGGKIIFNGVFTSSAISSSNTTTFGVEINGLYDASVTNPIIYGKVIVNAELLAVKVTLKANCDFILNAKSSTSYIEMEASSKMTLNPNAVISASDTKNINLIGNATLISNGGRLLNTTASITTNAYTLTLINYQNLYAVKAVSGTYTRKITGGGDIIIDANVI